MRRSAVLLALIALILVPTAVPQTAQHRHRVRQRSPGLSGGSSSSRHHRLQRCKGTRLRWCGAYYHQKPLEMKMAPVFSKACPEECSNVGVCNAMTGLCDCPAGWTGKECSEEQKRPCSAGGSQYAGPGTQPMSHIGQDKRDLNWTVGAWTASRCGGVCDDERAVCFCDDPLHGRVPAAEGSPPGTPPIRQGRPLPDHCQPAQDKHGNPINWGRVPYEKLYGKSGWCTVPAGVEPDHRCGCDVDGTDGGWCEVVTEQVCINSCSGHGTCQFGFCKCDPGWFGNDCAGRRQGQDPDQSAEKNKGLQERPWLKSGALVPPAGSVQPPRGAVRRRPLIFVYDVPAFAAARMLQYRGPKTACVWRYFDAGNSSVINGGWTYPLEMLLHEMLLQSSHRTLDPEEADFFYVPAYTSCFMWPIYGWADYPWWYSDGGPRVMHMANMLLELKEHIQQTYPYWNKTQGRNHIWLATHDEGACWFPKEIYDTSIILTHWGRMDEHHTSNTAYPPDNYTTPGHIDRGNKRLGQQGWTKIIEGHRCYTPGKDLVIPLPKFPAHYRWSPLLGAPAQKRTTLLYFRGDVGKHRLPNYSRGIRQRLYNLTKTHNWSTEFSIKIGDREDVPGEYSLGLASSKFCLVAPGDGWSPRAEDAILHGCIPVVIMDRVHAPLESIIDWDALSVRVQESQLAYLPHVLLAISPDRLARMQANLRKVWHRFAYLSQPIINAAAQEVKAHWKREQQSPSPNLGQPDEWDSELNALDEEWLEAQEAMHDRQGFYTNTSSSAAAGPSSRTGTPSSPAAAAIGGTSSGSGSLPADAAAGGDEASSKSQGDVDGQGEQSAKAPLSTEATSPAAGQAPNKDKAAASDASAKDKPASQQAAKDRKQGGEAELGKDGQQGSPTKAEQADGGEEQDAPQREAVSTPPKQPGPAAASKKPASDKAPKPVSSTLPLAAVVAGKPSAAISSQHDAADADAAEQADRRRRRRRRRRRQLRQAAAADDGDGADDPGDDEGNGGGSGQQQQPAPERAQQASSFKNWTFTDEHVEDDAFGTLMQWLYAKLLRRHNIPLQLVEGQQHHLPELAGGGEAAGQAAADGAGDE